MRSKRLSCEWTILRRDLTRFAPIWIVLSVFLLLQSTGMERDIHTYEDCFLFLAAMFGPICALSVFGYVTDPRECCAVHALPIRREGLFLTHCAAACLMYLVPVGVFCAVMGDCFRESFWELMFLSTLDFLVQFSLAVLCMMLTGRKIGAWLLYIFFQSAYFMFYYAMEVMYMPLLPGVVSPSLSGTLLAPVFSLVFGMVGSEPPGSADISVLRIVLTIAVQFGLSLLLYRRRKSEFAGDLLAVPKLHPVFAVCSGLTGMLAFDLFFSMNPGLDVPMILLGMAFGYFAYWMLSAKYARIFTLKRLVGFVLLAAVTIGSFFVTEMDPLGLVQRIPEVDQIQSVAFSERFTSEQFSAQNPGQIEAIRQLHGTLLEEMNSEKPYVDTVRIEYKLKNGATMTREYEVREGSTAEDAAWFLSQPKALFGEDDPKLDHLELRFDGRTVAVLSPEDRAELMEILLTEAREGKMFTFQYKFQTQWTILWYDADGHSHRTTIPNTARATVMWLTEHFPQPKAG